LPSKQGLRVRIPLSAINTSFTKSIDWIFNSKKNKIWNKRRIKRFIFKKKAFKIKKCYVKSILFVHKKGAKIKKYYTKSIPFVYYTRKKKIRRKSYFWGIYWRSNWKTRSHSKKKSQIRVWFWRKKKIKKHWRLWHNFFFFFKQHWAGNFFKYKLKNKWLPGGKRIERLVPRYQPKKKLILRAKDSYKKKLYFKKFLVKYYSFRRIHQVKKLYNILSRKLGSNIINFFMHLELQLSSVCLRMNFFWNLYKARLWINLGTIYVNGRNILFPKYLVKINDLVTLLMEDSKKKKYIFKLFFLKKNKFRKKKQKLLNYSEINFPSMSGILFFLPYSIMDLRLTLKKKKKHWLKAKVFSFLINSFY
jgi:ribosomal protein S4